MSTMYAILDDNALRITRRHPNLDVITALAAIECIGADITIAPFHNMRSLFTYTETELATLYTNLTGAKTARKGNELRALIIEAIDRLPQDDVLHAEVQRQADWVEANHPQGPLMYVKGASRPAAPPAPIVATVAPSADEFGAIMQLAAIAAKAPRLTANTAPPGGHPVQPQREAGAPRAPTEPRTSGVKALIWATADEAWEALGKTTDKAAVLAMRKAVMNTLEEQGVKRTSSSNELGNWQKARIVS